MVMMTVSGRRVAYIRDGDVLVVSSIDRLARLMTDLRQIVDRVVKKGAGVEFIHEHLVFSKDGTENSKIRLTIAVDINNLAHRKPRAGN